jgi:hypothetical protein
VAIAAKPGNMSGQQVVMVGCVGGMAAGAFSGLKEWMQISSFERLLKRFMAFQTQLSFGAGF